MLCEWRPWQGAAGEVWSLSLKCVGTQCRHGLNRRGHAYFLMGGGGVWYLMPFTLEKEGTCPWATILAHFYYLSMYFNHNSAELLKVFYIRTVFLLSHFKKSIQV
jgi:hypothetical protein